MKLRLYHGSQQETVEPKFGLGRPFHDYGKGFYLTDKAELAREWAVYQPNSTDGWVHAFDLDLDGLTVFDFRKAGVLPWVAELMRHRDADASAAYRRRAPVFIKRFGVDLSAIDVVVGWRADASYFYIVKAFVRDEVDADILSDLLNLGRFGIQYAIKTPAAYEHLKPASESRSFVPYEECHRLFERRDSDARETMRRLIGDPVFNRLNHLFSDLVREKRQV